MTEFFVPFADGEMTETVYSQLAVVCRCAVPFVCERIREIHWTHNGDYWVATVGEKLRGRSVRRRRRKGGNVEVTTRLTDPATVVAIFPGSTYYAVTNARPIGPVVSHWVNPFMAGHPTAVLRFDLPSS